MSTKEFNRTEKSILAGMQEAILYSKGRLKAKKHNISLPNIDVYEARDHLKLTQKQFAAAFGISIATLRNWEQGRRSPTGAAKVLLKIIQKEPEIVKQVLRG
ncbi:MULTISPECIES: helix-turn-helix domain-containing protein [Rickettsieae]|jgi:putative transcriptional regulator|uniref:helix-turn-helix domain-containing protein n=1 Tax=Rickettsieae TaxID=33988 RepID=UPI000BC68992|nr:helix-turn-helix domain-containing protein [Rickettsia endosymbiont of Culicoides newsteadi]MDN3030101.1 helix-turn-helix domain-containing protein [Candidatus Tisiphia sp.]OZG31327.1 transcriptional regulator [Rickettsia endosymbiont of Culicoides newsteadi]HJD63767.1 helix-turn-helix domain-containing protein [Rickettsia endosymbiont of Sericostoma sp.]